MHPTPILFIVSGLFLIMAEVIYYYFVCLPVDKEQKQGRKENEIRTWADIYRVMETDQKIQS